MTEHEPSGTAATLFALDNLACVYALDPATRNPAGSTYAPVVADGTVYLDNADGSGALTMLNATTGAVLRTWPASNVTNPTVSGGILYGGEAHTQAVRTPDSTYQVTQGPIVAQDAATGTQRWSNPAGHYAYSQPVLAGGTIYLAANDTGHTSGAPWGLIMALDQATGQTRWTRNLPNAITAAPTMWTP